MRENFKILFVGKLVQAFTRVDSTIISMNDHENELFKQLLGISNFSIFRSIF